MKLSMAKPSVLKISHEQRHGKTIITRLAGNLTENQIFTGKISHHERGAAFASFQISLRKRQNHHFAD